MRTKKRIKSPCNGICDIEPRSGICTSCKRTLNEIALWSSYPELVRERIMQDLKDRQLPGERHRDRLRELV
jgi:predicted Fe-S protein YdhL (DUF1289 family)